MRNSIQTRPHHDETAGELTRQNIEEIWKKLSAVFSRDNFALNSRAVSASTTLDNEDSVVIADTSSGAITLTLPLANSWGSSKSPVLVLLKTSANNGLTLQRSGSDTINYLSNGLVVSGATSLIAKNVSILVSNGSNVWWSAQNELDLELPYTRTLTGADTLTIVDRIVICSNSGANYNVTLPLANANGGLGQILHIQRDGSGATIVATVVKQGSDTLVVDGRVSASLNVTEGCTVISNGSNAWFLH